MGAYEYQALDARGRTRKGVTSGDTARQVRQHLRDQGLHPVAVLSVAEAAGEQPGRRRGRRLGATELALIMRQLASLVAAGLPLEEALATVAEQTERPISKRILVAMRARVMEGHSLSAGMAEFPRAFPELFRATVAAGEQSGHLDRVLGQLAEYAETREELGRKLGLALLYPLILTVVAIGVVAGLLTYVVPQVIAVFVTMDQELPTLTRMLIATSDWLGHFGHWLLLGLLAVALAWFALLRNRPFKYSWHRSVLQIPLVGRMAKGINAARFTRTLAILTCTSVPIVQALKIAAQVVTNLAMRQAVESAAARVREGTPLHQALGASNLFPPMTVRLIASGEKSGRLDDMLERAADNQERQVGTWVALMMGILEPLLILVVGGLVLVIVLAILLPVFEMNRLVR